MDSLIWNVAGFALLGDDINGLRPSPIRGRWARNVLSGSLDLAPQSLPPDSPYRQQSKNYTPMSFTVQYNHNPSSPVSATTATAIVKGTPRVKLDNLVRPPTKPRDFAMSPSAPGSELLQPQALYLLLSLKAGASIHGAPIPGAQQNPEHIGRNTRQQTICSASVITSTITPTTETTMTPVYFLHCTTDGKAAHAEPRIAGPNSPFFALTPLTPVRGHSFRFEQILTCQLDILCFPTEQKALWAFNWFEWKIRLGRRAKISYKGKWC